MLAGTRMLRRMLVRRTVATSRSTTFLARSQMDPPCADLHALLAFPFLRLPDTGESCDMTALVIGHEFLLPAE